MHLKAKQRKMRSRRRVPSVSLPILSTPMKEGETGRKIGEGIRRRGLWYLDREKNGGQESSLILAAVQGDKETMAMIHHCRMQHVSFDKMNKVYPAVMSKVDLSKLKCDACEYAKHTRTSYVSRGLPLCEYNSLYVGAL